MEKMRVKNPEKYEDRLLNFVYEIYRSTGGRYPRMEWLDQKPDVNDYDAFAKAYGDFLHYRLTTELDEIYIYEDSRIIATFGLLYRFDGKGIFWIEKRYKKSCLFLEFFMVHPSYRGRGIGKEILNFAREKARKMGKELCVVTFPDLDAYRYYLRNGFEEISRNGSFATLKSTI